MQRTMPGRFNHLTDARSNSTHLGFVKTMRSSTHKFAADDIFPDRIAAIVQSYIASRLSYLEALYGLGGFSAYYVCIYEVGYHYEISRWAMNILSVGYGWRLYAYFLLLIIWNTLITRLMVVKSWCNCVLCLIFYIDSRWFKNSIQSAWNHWIGVRTSRSLYTVHLMLIDSNLVNPTQKREIGGAELGSDYPICPPWLAAWGTAWVLLALLVDT